MIDLDELIFVDENDFMTPPETLRETAFPDDDGEFAFPDETEEAENLRYLEMLCRLDEFEAACEAVEDAAWREPD